MRRLQGLSPIELDVDNQYIALNYMWGKSAEIKPYDFGIVKGDLVRILLPIHFASGTAQRFSTEIFTITNVLKSQHPVLFRISDAAGQPLTQLWYLGFYIGQINTLLHFTVFRYGFQLSVVKKIGKHNTKAKNDST